MGKNEMKKKKPKNLLTVMTSAILLTLCIACFLQVTISAELPEKQDEKKPYILLKYAEQKYLVPMGDTPAGNARRVINALKDFQKLADQDKEHLDKVVSRKEELQNLVRSPDHSYSDQLAACEKEASRLREQIAVRAECGAFTD